MVRRHLNLLAQFLWMVLLLLDIAGRLPAQEPAPVAVPETVRPQDGEAKVVALPESRVSGGPKKELVLIVPTVEALTVALKNCDGFVLMMGERNILLPNLHSVDDAVLARRILNEVDGNKAIELFTQGSDILIRTPQENFAKPDLHDGIRFTRTIMEAQEHPEAAADQPGEQTSPSTIVQENVIQNLKEDDAQIWKRREATATQGKAAANVRVYALKNTRAADAAKIIVQLYNRALAVAVEERTNSLIVRGTDDIAEEIQALLMRLDDAGGATTTSDSPTSPAPDPLDVRGARMTDPDLSPRPQVVDLSVSDSAQQGRVFSFYFGTTGPAPSELRQKYDALERQAQSLSRDLRTPVKNPAQAGCTNCHDSTLGARPQLLDPMNCDELKKQLRDAVQQAFETRQRLQRAELTEFAKRLQGIQQSIELREKIRQQVIDRRVQELLDPNIKWDSLDAEIDTTNLSPPTPPASVNSAMASAAPMRAVSAKTVKIQALLFDIDEEAEPFDLSKVQHDAPDQLEVFLKAAAAKGQVNILSRPQLITRLNQEAMLTIGQTVALTKNGDQVTSTRDVGVKIAITPREESGKPVLKVNFDFSRIDPESNADDPDATPFIQSNSGELTVRMNEYGGKGKLLGPFQAVPGMNRFLHVIITLTDDVPVSLIPPEVQGRWQFHEFAIVGDRKHSPIPEHIADALKGRPPLVIDGEQMTRTSRDGTKTVYTIQYDSTTTPHRLTTTTFRGGQNRTERYIVQIDPGFLRLASTTDGSRNFPKSFDEPRTLVETYKRVLTEPARSDADSKADGSRNSSDPQPIKLDDLQGDWRLIITAQASGKNDGTKSERQVLDATIRGNRLTASTNPVQAADNQGKNANSPLRMTLHLNGTGAPQPVDLEYVLEASEAEELKESIDFYALRNGKPIAQAIIERRGDGFRMCIEHAKIVGRPLAFELGETAVLWELRPIEPSDSTSGLAPTVETIVAGLDEANAAIRNLSVTTDYMKRQRFLLPFYSTLEMQLTTKAIIDSEGRSRNETDGQQVNIEPDGKAARTYRGRWVGVSPCKQPQRVHTIHFFTFTLVFFTPCSNRLPAYLTRVTA